MDENHIRSSLLFSCLPCWTIITFFIFIRNFMLCFQCEMTGVVVDVGDGATHIVPVADGYVIGSSIRSIPLTGNDVTQFIQQLMKVASSAFLMIATRCYSTFLEQLQYVNLAWFGGNVSITCVRLIMYQYHTIKFTKKFFEDSCSMQYNYAFLILLYCTNLLDYLKSGPRCDFF